MLKKKSHLLLQITKKIRLITSVLSEFENVDVWFSSLTS